MIRLTALWLAFALLAAPLGAQESVADAARAAQARLAAASEQLDAAQGARDRVAALTATITAYEEGLVAMRAGLRRAAIRQSSLETQLDAKSAEVGQLLGVLQSMGRAPSPLLLLHPTGPIGTARSGMIAAEVTPGLQREVNALRAQLEEIAVLRALQESAASTLSEGLAGAQAARTALSSAISDRTDLPQRFEEDPVQLALLIESSETLDAFSTGLAETRAGAAEPITAQVAKGNIALPVQGQLLRRFNAQDAAGVTRPGVILAARPRALVTTPTPATVLFRGPLLDYGNVIILEPAADVMFVLAGLAEVFGMPGQVLPAGAPVGLMGGDLPSGDGILTASEDLDRDDASQTLYLEVREGQSPVDPATWFALESR